ncbi:MAG: TA system antitoxin ParD family protein [Candidatus Rokuibacteriota bacterium]
MKTKRRIRKPTPIPVRFGPDELSLFRLIAARADAQSRSISGQLKHYARLGLITEDNPDLPLSFIEGILEAQAEFRAGLGLPYRWGVLNGHPGPVPGPGPAPDSAPEDPRA